MPNSVAQPQQLLSDRLCYIEYMGNGLPSMPSIWLQAPHRPMHGSTAGHVPIHVYPTLPHQSRRCRAAALHHHNEAASPKQAVVVRSRLRPSQAGAVRNSARCWWECTGNLRRAASGNGASMACAAVKGSGTAGARPKRSRRRTRHSATAVTGTATGGARPTRSRRRSAAWPA